MNKFIIITLLCLQWSLSARLFQRQVNDPADTLEIFALKVEFKKESPDKSITTGDGTFNSGPGEFKLDPSGSRDKNSYWESQLEFAKQYYSQISRNKLHIEYRVFPESNPWQLDKEIVDYNRSTQLEGEKTEELDSARIDGYLKFVRETIELVAQDQISPFDIPLTPGRQRVYLIIHAGSNRLVDGGSLGTQGADTPSDFFDAYLGPRDFQYYSTIPQYLSDTSGIVLQRPGVDTLDRLMVVSETSSQDEINWGLGGILISQIGEALGLPATYDPSEGATQLGRFDLMDFAGYSSGNGFFPTAPSAWHRIYLGWDQAQVLNTPTQGKQSTHTIRPSFDTTSTVGEIYQIPINTNEYLLLEYRTRSHGKTISVTNAKGQVYTVPSDSIEQLFLDTLCNDKGQDCQANSKQAEGIFVDADNFDLALPASGVLVWKVNQWLIDENIETGFINRRLSQTGDHYKGITLVEADGILTMGKEFTNALGRPSYDFGSGKEMLPHIFKDSKDTITTIHPWGYGNTGSSQGGFTHLQLRVDWPDSGLVEENRHQFTGDSILNIRADSLIITLDWGENRIPGSQFPQGISSSTHPQSIISWDSLVFLANDSGSISILTQRGDTLNHLNSNNKSFQGSALYAANDSSITYVHRTKPRLLLVHLSRSSDQWSINQTQVLRTTHFQAGPLLVDSNLYWVQDGELYTRELTPPSSGNSQALTKLPSQIDQLLWDPQAKLLYLLAREGQVFQYTPQDSRLQNLSIVYPKSPQGTRPQAGERFNAVLSDFNQDGETELFLISEHGYSTFYSPSQGRHLEGSPRTYSRTLSARGGVAVSDLNGDAYPDVAWNGDDQLYVLDYRNQFLDGFPFEYTTNYHDGILTQTPLFLDLDQDIGPEILSPSPLGLLYGIQDNGQAIKKLNGQESDLACSDQQLTGTGKIQSCGVSWPLNIGPSTLTRQLSPISTYLTPFEDGVQLLATGESEIHSWYFPRAENSVNSWLMDGANPQRHYYFDASQLTAQDSQPQAVISKFYLYPSPLRFSTSNVFLSTLAPFEEARLRVFDVSGLEVFDEELGSGTSGLNRFEAINLNHLSAGVYSARIDVQFDINQSKTARFRMTVIR